MDERAVLWYHFNMSDTTNKITENSAAKSEEAKKRAEEAKKRAEEAKKRALKIKREQEKRKYFEFYDDIKHDRNKEW